MYDELIAELRQHHCDAKEDDTQEVCEECAYDVIIADKSVPSGIASVCVCGLMNRAADAIENVSKAYRMMAEAYESEVTKPRWIPVTERLPEIDMSYPHHEDYLVQYDSGNMDVASWSNVNRFWTDHVTKPHWNCVQFAEVIAWMPLPEPPKEES